MDYYAAELNPGIDLAHVGIHDERQAYLWRMCKQHLMFQSFKSVIDNFKKGHGSSMNCKVCQKYNDMKDNAITPSTYEETAYLAMSHVPGVRVVDWMTDVRVLRGNFSSADIWIPLLNLCIMIDGEGHFGDHTGRSVEDQEEADDMFNYEAIDRGLTVFRLHFQDANLTQALLSSVCWVSTIWSAL